MRGKHFCYNTNTIPRLIIITVFQVFVINVTNVALICVMGRGGGSVFEKLLVITNISSDLKANAFLLFFIIGK